MASDPGSTEVNRATARSLSCCIWPAFAALVFLRLCVGWHFFSEGIKKLEYDSGRGEWNLAFSAEGFLNGAKGPLASFFQNQAPTTHHWRTHLAIPQQLEPTRSAKLSGWVAGYVKRRQAELTSGKATAAQFADFSPTAKWATEIKSDWQAGLDRFKKIKWLSDKLREQADAVYKKYELYLADLLAEEASAIESFQHDVWRLEQAQQVPGAEEVPFEVARVAELQANVDRTPGKWVAAVKSLDQQYADELRGLVSAPKLTAQVKQVDAAVTDPDLKRLSRMNVLVTSVVIGVGVCLLLGLFTRVAAIVGALFLLSVMATQPPWVPGAMTLVFNYQLVEFAALLFLAAVGAGRWAGLDFIIQGLWRSRRGAQGA